LDCLPHLGQGQARAAECHSHHVPLSATLMDACNLPLSATLMAIQCRVDRLRQGQAHVVECHVECH